MDLVALTSPASATPQHPRSYGRHERDNQLHHHQLHRHLNFGLCARPMPHDARQPGPSHHDDIHTTAIMPGCSHVHRILRPHHRKRYPVPVRRPPCIPELQAQRRHGVLTHQDQFRTVQQFSDILLASMDKTAGMDLDWGVRCDADCRLCRESNQQPDFHARCQ